MSDKISPDEFYDTLTNSGTTRTKAEKDALAVLIFFGIGGAITVAGLTGYIFGSWRGRRVAASLILKGIKIVGQSSS